MKIIHADYGDDGNNMFVSYGVKWCCIEKNKI